MSRYFLSTHSFACEAGSHAVFLDLKRNEYTAVSPRDLAVLRQTVQGWPAGDPDLDDTCETDEADSPNVIDVLTREGLITADAVLGKEAAPVLVETPTSTFQGRPRPWPQLTRHHVRNFVSTWALATAMLKVRQVSWIVERAKRRKDAAAPTAPPFDMVRARHLTAVHSVLQPLFYPALDACLRNSITLLEFLSRYGVYPTWVFGVRMKPFAAHCWIQHGSIVFTDPIDHVMTFTPIMSI